MLKLAGLFFKNGSNVKYDIYDLVNRIGSASDNAGSSEYIFVPIPLEFELVGNSLSDEDNGIYLNLKLRKDDF